MSINAAGFDFARFMPGFGFLQQAGQPQEAGLAFSQWIAPTLDPQETGRRIQELKTVLFWLEQNVTALKATIQALEVQQLTCQTLQDMNAGMVDWAQKMQEAVTRPPDTASPSQEEAAAQQEEAPASPAADDPALHPAMEQAGQWWHSLLQTFGQIASHAQQEVAQRQEAFAQSQKEFAASVSKKTDAPPAAAAPARPARKQSAPAAARRAEKPAAPASSAARAASRRKTGTSGAA